MKKAVITNFNEVLGFVDVEKHVGYVDVAGYVTWKWQNTYKQDPNYDTNEDPYNIPLVEVESQVIDSCVNVRSYKCTANKKYFKDEILFDCDGIKTAVDSFGDTVYYLI
jgi:hypothetical protein